MAVEVRPLPETFPATRDALHRVAEQLVAPARKPHNEIALRQTPGGFGTPEFEFDGRRTQVRVEGVDLVLARDDDEERAELSSIAAGGAFLGPLLLPDGVPDDDSPLNLDPRAADGLAAFYAFAAQALKRVKSDLGPGDDPSDTNLWPEHFDIAFAAGSDAKGMRANYGASPGDDDHAEPYVYVGPWSAPTDGDLWNASAFNGAELGYGELVAGDEPAAMAVEFMRSRRAALTVG
jgi:hypothetical protein